ncbi:hypothetical protein GCU60_11025 [Blastococcus saxobsidens]|uniref:Uncharacterized protein n=1 Tax=Blastococcus saxobsidens TaxID=138336 RepID=A0A6L9W2H0_9ACTN|nr:hypothetical protein [Blastococcus saxobsidens]NEK86286.1 hypothetical protein [Blastococcus saxobsidens]
MIEDPPARPAARRLPWWALVPLAAVAWWVGGHLFWLLGGLRMTPVGARTALPLVPAMLSYLVLGALVGGVAAGMLGRATARRGLGVAATAGGTVLAVALALVATVTTLRENAPDNFETEPAVLLGLGAVVVVVSALGWGVGALAVLGPAGAVPGLAVLAGAAPWWFSSVVSALVGFGSATTLGHAGPWLGAALLVAALLLVGSRPLSRLGWWPVVVLGAWLVSPALTAASYLEQLLRPGYGLPRTLPDSLSAAWDVFGLASMPGQRDLAPWLAAVAVAAVLTVVLPRIRPSAPLRLERQEEVTGVVG